MATDEMTDRAAALAAPLRDPADEVRAVTRGRRLALGLLAALLLAVFGVPAEAQRFGRSDDDWYPLGGLEARGDLASVDEVPAIEIKAVAEGGLADRGGLKVGDRIVKVDGKKLKGKGDERIDLFCLQVERAEGKRPRGQEPATLDLAVIDAAGEKALREVPVRFLGGRKDTPEGCKKTATVLDEALDYLARHQGEEGNFPKDVANANQALVTAALAGLAFLGAGERWQTQQARALSYVSKNVLDAEAGSPFSRGDGGGPNWNQTNWSLSYGAIFLAEWLAKHPQDAATRALLERVVAKLFANQEATGGWAHGPGGPNALGYLELEIMSNYALAGIGMAQRLGIEPEEGKLVKAIEYVKACTTGGGVAYSTRPGQAGAGDPGRTAGAYWAFRQLDRKEKVVSQMAKFFDRGLDELPQGHVSPVMHILAGGLASAQRGKSAMKSFWKIYLPYVMASRDRDGAFDARPTEESRSLKSNSDRSNGKTFVTAHFALLLQLGQDRFELLDTEPR